MCVFVEIMRMRILSLRDLASNKLRATENYVRARFYANAVSWRVQRS